MPYQTRPRYQARVQPRAQNRVQARERPAGKQAQAAPAGRWEPRLVLDALSDLHNAPERSAGTRDA